MIGRPQSAGAAAFHESGHALAALELGLPITQVSILRGDHRGLATAGSCDIVARDVRVTTLLVFFFAGRVAQELYLNSSDTESGAAADVEDAQRYAAMTSGTPEQRRVLCEVCASQAYELIVQRWEDVRAVAHRLLERKSLSGDEVAGTINEAKIEPLDVEFELEIPYRGKGLRMIDLREFAARGDGILRRCGTAGWTYVGAPIDLAIGAPKWP